MSKQPNCKQRLTAISKMLINCEMEFMCQYCFCHLENVRNLPKGLSFLRLWKYLIGNYGSFRQC